MRAMPLNALLDVINESRRSTHFQGPSAGSAEDEVERRYQPCTRLAVYGSLRPGKENAHVLRDLHGTWDDGYVHGTLHASGWGAILGYPALRLRDDGDPVPVHVLSDERLPEHWTRIDTFEGQEYCRVLAPVYRDGVLSTVANIYEARET